MRESARVGLSPARHCDAIMSCLGDRVRRPVSSTMRGSSRVCVFGVLLLLLSLLGCSSSSPIRVDKPLDATHEKLMKIGMAYARFSASHKRPPKTWADLGTFLAESEMPTRPLALRPRRAAVGRLLGRRSFQAPRLGQDDARACLRETGRRRHSLRADRNPQRGTVVRQRFPRGQFSARPQPGPLKEACDGGLQEF